MKNKQLDKQTIAERFRQMMHDEQIYLNPHVNRDSVAASMGTNRTYLCNYIREVYGQTFPEYIATLRLDDAIGMLRGAQAAAVDIQGVAEAVGFIHYSSFYRAFIKRYGMKPSDFLNSLTK